MTPGRRTEGVRVATSLRSFGLTVRGVRYTPSVRSELSKWLMPISQHAQFLGLSQRAVMLCHPRIVARISVEGVQSAAMARHLFARSPQRSARYNGFDMTPTARKTAPDRMSAIGHNRQVCGVSSCSRQWFHTFASDTRPPITRSRVLLDDDGGCPAGTEGDRSCRSVRRAYPVLEAPYDLGWWSSNPGKRGCSQTNQVTFTQILPLQARTSRTTSSWSASWSTCSQPQRPVPKIN
jgi:hypothetical protein